MLNGRCATCPALAKWRITLRSIPTCIPRCSWVAQSEIDMVKRRGESETVAAVEEGTPETGNGSSETGRRKGLTRWPAMLSGVPASPRDLLRPRGGGTGQLFEWRGG